MSLFFIGIVNATDYAAGTFSFSGSFDSWAKCSETGYGSNTAGNYMYKSITPASGGGMYDVYVYADMDNNLCTSCDFYVDGVDVWPTVSLYAASSSCEARLLGSIPLSSSAHEFRFDRSTDAGNWVELVHLTVNYASGETCGAGQYAYGGSCTNVGAGYYSPASDNDRYACAAGYYCSTATNSASTGNGQCSAGYYGSSTGQTAATCNGQCTAGYYCTAGSTSATQNVCGTGKYCPTGSSGATNCVAGYYGSSTTNSVSTCNGACTAGYYCTAGSTSATQNACGTGNYCPAGSSGATACPAGTYGSTTTLTTSSCTGQCSAGYYGSSTGQTAATCNGQCTAGYYCTAGSTSATQNVCGTGKYCPTGSSGTTNCAAGYYGSSTTNSVSTCNGACTAGYYCTAGSTSATQNVCGANNYCPSASTGTTACPGNSGSGGRTTQSAATDCNCDTDYYDADGGTQDCTSVGVGYYSASDSDSRTVCTTKVANADYNSSGAGSNSCSFACIGGLEPKSGCAETGINKNLYFINNVTNYGNITIESGSKIYLNSSNLTLTKLLMNGVGDQVFINSGSQLIINGSN